MSHFNYKKTYYQLHKWLSLLFSLPFILLAISGIIISLKPEPQSLDVEYPVPVIDVLLKLQSERSQWTFPRVNFTPDYFTIYGLHEGELRLLTIERKNGSLVSEEDPSQNIFFSFQTLHESFYLDSFGRRLVGVSGLILVIVVLSGLLFWARKSVYLQIKNLCSTRSFKSLKGLHLVIGVGLSIPIFYAAITGFMIVFDPYVEKEMTYSNTVGCTLDISANTIRNLDIGKRGILTICRPNNLISLINEKGIVKMLPSGLRIYSISRSEMYRSIILRRMLFTDLHDGSFFGPFREIYNLIIGISLLALTTSGLLIWFRRRRKFCF